MRYKVASLADAWIETALMRFQALRPWSRPSRTRGLKPVYISEYQMPEEVASLADAWIETFLNSCKGL